MKETTEKQITKYTSRAELLEDLINWNESNGLPTKEEKYVTAFKEIHARLLRSNGEKFPIAGFIQKHKLSQVEVFLLLRLSVLDMQRSLAPGFYQVATLLDKGQTFGTRQELITILLDHKSALFTEGIFVFISGRIDVKKNLLMIPAAAQKAKSKKRTLNPKRVLAELNKYVIGQEEAKKQVVAGVFEHLAKCAASKNGQLFSKSNIFISGPTGSGKSYICERLAKILNIPYVHADANQYTQTGYVGMDVGDMLRPLTKQAKEGKLPVSIVFIDEIDKLRIGSEKWGSSSGNVQAELLRLIESTYYRLETKMALGKSISRWDISQVLFVVGGAFENLQVRHADKTVGFTQLPALQNRTLTADDFIGYGMMPELIGRFSYFVQLKGLEKNDLRQILLNPHNGPLQQYKELLHTSASVSPEVVETLVANAYERHLGARGLHQQVGQLFQAQFLENKVQIEI